MYQKINCTLSKTIARIFGRRQGTREIIELEVGVEQRAEFHKNLAWETFKAIHNFSKF